MSTDLTESNPNWEGYYSTLKRMPKRLKETAQFIIDVLPYLRSKKAKKVLDLGCGTGRHCVLLGNRSLEVVGIDISKSALRMARTWVRKEKSGDIAFVLATMTHLPLNDCCLDAVISVSVLHHALKEDIGTTVNEIHRTLKENGLFLANLASVNDPRFGTGRMVEGNTFLIQEAFEEKLFEELHHFFAKLEVLRLLHRFHKKKVTKMKDKPSYWKVQAFK